MLHGCQAATALQCAGSTCMAGARLYVLLGAADLAGVSLVWKVHIVSPYVVDRHVEVQRTAAPLLLLLLVQLLLQLLLLLISGVIDR